MSKPYKAKTTESSRRHAYSSFRDRIEAIKIEPSLNLSKRAHDYVESSHLLATLEHWKEVNISGNFIECLDKIEVYCQSLPQILHHKDIIFNALCTHIEINDVHSIQPLLEMLAQFVHDLGPDFLPYYSKFLKMLTELALEINPNDSQNNRNSSNVLEWIFNCLAFTFKYLSRNLVADLMPTFQMLLPLLELQKKVYISRFCAEALSFLIRKLKGEALTSIIKYSFDEKIDTIRENSMYCESLSILYSESMKNTKGTFHSKSSLILSKIIENTLKVSDRDMSAKLISIVSDILLNVIHHGSEESCLKFYVLVTDFLKETISTTENTSSFTGIVQIISSLTFAESGRKANWSSVISTISILTDRLRTVEKQNEDINEESIIFKTELMESLLYLFVVLFRNCDIQNLTKCHNQFFTSMMELNNGEQFLLFIESCCNVTKGKIVSFGIGKYLGDFLSMKSHSEVQLQKIAFFLSRMEERDFYGISPKPKVPVETAISIVRQLETNYQDISTANDLVAVYWRLLLLKSGESSNGELDEQYLRQLLEQLTSKDFAFSSRFAQDLASVVIHSLINISKTNSESLKFLVESVIRCLDTFQKSSLFIDSINRLFKEAAPHVQQILDENFNDIVYKLVNNLSLPSHESRLSTIELLFTINAILSKPESQFLSQIRIIEQTPLALSSGRDISLRVRNMTLEFKKLESVTDFEQHLVTNFAFGMLTNKFQPCWLAVFEGLPFITSKILASKLVWELSFKFIQLNYESQDEAFFTWYNDESTHVESSLIDWQPQDVRLRENFINLENNVISKYRNISYSIMEYAETRRGNNVYSKVMRSLCIQALSAVPSIAERNSEKIVPIILNQNDDETSEDGMDSHLLTASWTLKDRVDFITLFTKFKNLKKVSQSKLLYEHVLRLLCHRQLQIQKLALDVILNWGIGSVNKYGDNLRNLLDDTIFRDEISNFITKSTDSKIEHSDLEHLMPLVLRILFGRAQGTPKSNSKAGKKFAVISILPNFSEKEVIDFLNLGSESLKYREFLEDNEKVDLSKTQIRKINGYVNLLSEVYKTLGLHFTNALSTTIEPLVYSLVVAQKRIELADQFEEEDAVIVDKTARSIRQIGMRCLNDLFMIMGESFDWDEHIFTIYEHLVKPRMENFAIENLQQPSSLMKIILGWIDLPNTLKFLYFDNFAPIEAIASLTSQTNAKDSVVSSTLEFTIKALSKKNMIEDNYFTLLAIIVNSLLKSLPSIIDHIADKEIGALVITVLLLLIEGNYIHDDDTKASLLESLTKALDKPQSQIDPSDKANILLSLSSIVDTYDCSFEQILSLYQVCSKSFRLYSDKRVRETLVSVFLSIGKKFPEVQEVSELLADLNSYSPKRMQEYDFERRLSAFKKINEEIYENLTPTQWLPLIYCGLFFINDANELIMRTNGVYVLKRFVDCVSVKQPSEAEPYISQFKDIVLPYLKIGLRKENEDIQSEYIDLLEHCVSAPQYFESFNDMKVLTYDNDDDKNFFKNVNHIQLHNRQRAVKNLIEARHNLNENSISHFILPIIEHYALSKEDKFMGIGLQTLETIGYLVRCVSWNHFKAIFKRYIMNLKKSTNDLLKKNVNMIVAISSAFMSSVRAKNQNLDEDLISNLPDQSEIDLYILKDLFPSLLKVLVVRNDDTIVARAPLSEAMCSLIMCISNHLIESELPSILTSTCQVMRSRSEELRDAIRKTLCKILRILGPLYLKFILQELKTALSRGSQIHVLSFTVHHLLASISDSLKFGDLNDSLSLIIDIVMEDTFGAAGQEKDAEGYHSKMKEVKFKKSFDTGEIISSNINLSYFSLLLEPIKLLLKEHISLKTQNKLDELLRRYALGLNHNEEAAKQDILLLCYEINKMAFEQKEERGNNNVKPSEDHFLVKLTSKPQKTHVSNTVHIHTLQKFSFELLRTALSRNEHLASASNLSGFLPLLEEGLKSDNEGVVVSALRILNSFIRLPFLENENSVFEECAKVSLNIIKDSPTTNSEICQAALKFLATTIRHKPDINLTETAVRYILVRIQPDLEEPNRQGLAFNFLKAVVSQHIMIPEVYDVMDKVAKIMVVNHAKEIRDMSRSVYYQFLMEYDQGRGKLEKQFKFLVNNLAYPTEAGRQSVMELIHLVIIKSGSDLLNKLASSFFVSLANVLAADDSSKCREMATSLIASIFKSLEDKEVEKLEKYIFAWIGSQNLQLKRCGFNIYKIYITEFEYGSNELLDKNALTNVQSILNEAKYSEDNEVSIEWDLLYSALNVFTTICSSLKEKVFVESFEDIWKRIIETLLFPHAWIRLISSRLIGLLLSNLDSLDFEMANYDVQTICYRLLRQLGAPSITEELGNQNIKNIVIIAMKWESNDTVWETGPSQESGKIVKTELANDQLISRTCAIMRQEHNYKDSFVSKKSSIKLAAMLVQVTSTRRLPAVAEKLLLSLFNFKDLNAQNSKEEEELVNLTLECMQMIEEKLGVTEYSNVYALAKLKVDVRRQERKTKRAQLAVNAPEVAAKRKLKKHERSREKRKHEKDENGYYRLKKKRFN
ncbi:uncharacterized protein CANTADRAFT_26116 [Suhomyces tanzawaensis NRRL Y-17324]|uniref:Uncharacterized protein n=1 Tax=Suhomyces tanzawaensis NRRL Y-17324 TaxID=984487 RepID=A0A1E4SHT5_9ASCO|nr:uncharacterized protein CANTADRAFT_26116 [Suhomyces tanzawaensis NRRL Y-17324]ODV79040.1 hypothetical protein CANTADRAFT_26116 [Suhomyces tanzawaensis NRRL Y-17324]